MEIEKVTQDHLQTELDLISMFNVLKPPPLHTLGNSFTQLYSKMKQLLQAIIPNVMASTPPPTFYM